METILKAMTARQHRIISVHQVMIDKRKDHSSVQLHPVVHLHIQAMELAEVIGTYQTDLSK